MSFTDARLKVKRANKHIADIDRIVASLPDRYVMEVEDQRSGGHSIKHGLPQSEQILRHLALLIGDAIHNLKTALDYAWLRTIEKLAPDAVGDFAKFPIRKTREELEAALKGRKIHISSPALFERIISDVKSYKGGNDLIYALHILDISDKHRLLIPLMNVAVVDDIVVKTKKGEVIKGSTWATTGPGPYYVDFDETVEIESTGKLAITIAFKQQDALQGLNVSDTLTGFAKIVLYAIQLLEDLTAVS